MECGVAVIDPQGQLIMLNTAARGVLSLTQPLPAPASCLPESLQTLARQILEHPGEPSTEERQTSLQSGRSCELQVSAFPLPFPHGGTGVLQIFRGIKSESPIEPRIRHLERLARLGVLSAGLAHELRNSMVAISTFSDAALEKEPHNELIQTVRRELNRANSLAEQMLKHARVNHACVNPVSVHGVLNRALTLALPKLKETGAKITTQLQAQPDIIAADEGNLEQVFLNLLLNAADAVAFEGDISLTTEVVSAPENHNMVKVTVADSGAGIGAEDLRRLFQPFFTTKRHGTGLGLYLAQRIVQEHSGTITVESSPGKGTQVHVLLPRETGRAVA